MSLDFIPVVVVVYKSCHSGVIGEIIGNVIVMAIQSINTKMSPC